jgi:peptidyl-dipeptidase A
MTDTDLQALQFIQEHTDRIAGLFEHSNLAMWKAATTGSEDAIRESAEARAAIRRAYSDREQFERVRGLLASGDVADPLLARQLVLLNHYYTANQLPEETIQDLSFREAELESIFYNFRAHWGGQTLSNNELRELLERETDSAKRRGIWEAAKQIGQHVRPKLLELVRRRNEAARSLGFANFYSMELALQEIDEEELFELLDDFRYRSDSAFRDLRERMDAGFAGRFGLPVEELRPWHWDDFFSQEAPGSAVLDLDPLFAGIDQESFVRAYFDRLRLPVDEILRNSDLYEREGKDQNAFCIDIDREGDVRVLANLRPDERWMRILLHELGHAVYDRYIPRTVPFLLRTPAHTMSTEAIAMFFGRLTRDPEWLRAHVAKDLETAAEAVVNEQQRLSMLVAARWILVMVYFERKMYRDPDRPDLNRCWWDLVERFQLIRRPDDRDEPDWATKIHLSLSAVYYHNYLLGELMASQITAAMRNEATPTELGEWLRERIFDRGATLHWNELLREATGEPLSARHFVEQFVGAAAGI